MRMNRTEGAVYVCRISSTGNGPRTSSDGRRRPLAVTARRCEEVDGALVAAPALAGTPRADPAVLLPRHVAPISSCHMCAVGWRVASAVQLSIADALG